MTPDTAGSSFRRDAETSTRDARAPQTARREIERLIRYKEPIDARDKKSWLARHAAQIEQILDALKICDPAIGSGAFPIGLLQEIFWTKMTLHPGANRAVVKRAIIQNSIHGVDLDGGAVEIARLRFWLALIVDEDEPLPLPNLDYQIMQGNSLLESFEGIDLSRLSEPARVGIQLLGSAQAEFGLAAEQAEMTVGTAPQSDLADLQQSYFDCHDPEEKARLRARIDAAVLRAIDFEIERRREMLAAALENWTREIARKKRANKGQYDPTAAEKKKRATWQAELAALTTKSERLHKLLTNSRAERPFFLWHLWFREIFAAGGFDIVIANPPYVRQEALSQFKPEFERCYDAFDGAADLYVYFMEAGVQFLRDGGILSFITSNSFLRTGYGEALRCLLKKECAVIRIVDFGGVPVFESAKDTYVCIPLLAKGKQQECVEVCQIPSFAIRDLGAYVAANRFMIPHERLTDEAWSLKSDVEAALFEKIMKAGKPLGDFVQRKFARGVTTGLNAAFVVNTPTKDRLIAADKRSAELIRPLVGGEDIRRWVFRQNDQWLIFTRRGVDIDRYPAIKAHLAQWKEELTPKESKDAKRGRKPGRYEWFEIQDDVAYYEIFDGPKIIYPDIAKGPRFCLDDDRHYLANTAYCLGSDSLYLLGILNSRLFWFAIANISIPFGVRAGQYRYRLIYQYMEKVPIHVINFADPAEKAAHDAIEGLVDRILAAKRAGDEATVKALEAEIDTHVFRLYGLTPEEIQLIKGAR